MSLALVGMALCDRVHQKKNCSSRVIRAVSAFELMLLTAFGQAFDCFIEFVNSWRKSSIFSDNSSVLSIVISSTNTALASDNPKTLSKQKYRGKERLNPGQPAGRNSTRYDLHPFLQLDTTAAGISFQPRW